jgi:hypothetical protein
MVDNLNPIEKLMTENFIYNVYGIRDRCKLTSVPFIYLCLPYTVVYYMLNTVRYVISN